MKRIQFFIDEAKFEDVKSCAKYMGLTLDNMARHALYQYMKKNKKYQKDVLLSANDKECE